MVSYLNVNVTGMNLKFKYIEDQRFAYCLFPTPKGETGCILLGLAEIDDKYERIGDETFLRVEKIEHNKEETKEILAGLENLFPDSIILVDEVTE